MEIMKEEKVMNRHEYLRILSERLGRLPHDEYANIMEYYTEYFEDAGEENEIRVMEELGTPEALADRIINENMGKAIPFAPGQPSFGTQGMNQPYNPMYQPQPQPKQGLSTGWKVAIAIITFPIWIGIVGAVVGIIGGFSIAAFACIASGVATFVAGAAVIGSGAGTAVLFMGGGLIVFAVGVGFVIAVGGIIHLIVKLYKSVFAKKQAYAM